MHLLCESAHPENLERRPRLRLHRTRPRRPGSLRSHQGLRSPWRATADTAAGVLRDRTRPARQEAREERRTGPADGSAPKPEARLASAAGHRNTLCDSPAFGLLCLAVAILWRPPLILAVRTSSPAWWPSRPTLRISAPHSRGPGARPRAPCTCSPSPAVGRKRPAITPPWQITDSCSPPPQQQGAQGAGRRVCPARGVSLPVWHWRTVSAPMWCTSAGGRPPAR